MSNNKSDSSATLVENMETSEDTSPERNSRNWRSKDKSKKAPKKSTESENGNHVDNELSIPQPILRRVNALRKLQLQSVNIEAEFYQKLHELEVEFTDRVVPLHEQRKKIINGNHEPSDEECNISVPLEQEFLADELEKQAAIKKDLPDSEKKLSDKGIDEFWATVLRNDMAIGSLVETDDEPILRHLTDIELKVFKNPMKFTLVFHFSPNEYFSNETLTKEYTLNCEPDKDSPFEFSGTEITGSKGCKIDWKEGKNVTIKTVTKKQKHKHKGEKRIVKKEEKAESFFNFFSPPELPENEQEITEQMSCELEMDYELGHIFRDRIVSKAVLIYTGELVDEDDDYEEEGEDDMEFDESDEEEEDD